MEKSIEEIDEYITNKCLINCKIGSGDLNIEEIDEYITNKYLINCKIGAGDSSIVYSIIKKTTNETFVLKMLSKDEINKREKINRIMMEKEILEKIHHPLIISNH